MRLASSRVAVRRRVLVRLPHRLEHGRIARRRSLTFREHPGRKLLGWPLLSALLTVVIVAGGVLTWRMWPRHPAESSVDVGFVRDMITHHDQAVAMATIIHDRSDDPDLVLLTTDIALTQQGQIGIMRGWLDGWDRLPTGSDLPMTWMGQPTEGRSSSCG